MNKCRRVEYIDDLVITHDENILVVDNGCDQSIININSFFVKSFAGVLYNVGGALRGMRSSALELVNDAFTLVHTPRGKIIFQLNQCFLDRDPSQDEALLQPHQCRDFGVMVDDCAKCHLNNDGDPGGQCIRVGDDIIPMHFDGWKCYFRISKPTEDDIATLPVYTLTSSRPYEPQCRLSSRRIHSPVGSSTSEWRRRLGFPTLAITIDTLNHTTNMVQTMESETRDYMRDHYKTRVWSLRPKRINDVCYSDTFFSSVPSIRKFKCFQMFVFKQSAFEYVYSVSYTHLTLPTSDLV